jgi:hypothetical protein
VHEGTYSEVVILQGRSRDDRPPCGFDRRSRNRPGPH